MNLVTPRNFALMPRGASQRSMLSGRTRSHRNHCNWTGPGCTNHLHSFRRNCLTTCSNLGQARVWEVRLSESAEVLESAQPLSREWAEALERKVSGNPPPPVHAVA